MKKQADEPEPELPAIMLPPYRRFVVTFTHKPNVEVYAHVMSLAEGHPSVSFIDIIGIAPVTGYIQSHVRRVFHNFDEIVDMGVVENSEIIQ